MFSLEIAVTQIVREAGGRLSHGALGDSYGR